MNDSSDALEREILRPLWKIHILRHAGEEPILGNWMLEELREHGYRVSPGTLYPMLMRLARLGWLAAEKTGKGNAVRYRLTKDGRAVLDDVQARLKELQRDVFSPRRGAKR